MNKKFVIFVIILFSVSSFVQTTHEFDGQALGVRAVTVEAMKEQQAQIEKLKEENSDFRKVLCDRFSDEEMCGE